MKIHRRLNKNYRYRNKLKGLKAKQPKQESKIDRYIAYTNKRIKRIKASLYNQFTQHNGIRHLRHEALMRKKSVISVFESTLTRTLGIKQDQLSDDIMVIQTYFFDILRDLIYHGFIYNNEKYICFTASAGQIRTKKTVFIKESVYRKHNAALMCGLTVDKINELGGVNINKYLAYLALCNSATEEWIGFDINKAIVVEDMETPVHSIVDFIDDKTYEITRQSMDIDIEHTDGSGMILPRKCKKSMMVRLPWIKGLLVPFPFDKFIREANCAAGEHKYGVIRDIYGVEHDIIKEKIEVIFTKSQFKMWKYYSSWDEYRSNFVKYNCQAGKCNEEDDEIGNAKLNYQMLQTLTDITDDELIRISERTRKKILNVGSDRKTMLRLLGVTDLNTNKNYLQQALKVYPELLNDTYSKEILKQVKRSMVKNAKSGKVDISGKYTFISPDLYAFCEYLILDNKQPKGLLSNGEVFCSLYKDGEKLDCLRSPHLYREHAVRVNVIDKDMKRWFVTNALYTSCHDPISKVLMFDNDGDKALVCNDETLVEAAERNMNGIYPLYYKMAKAAAEKVTNETIYNGLVAAYTGGNIGMISNDITKLWNSDNVNFDVIKLLCMENNFTIDYAKTLYKPTRPQDKKKLITAYTKSKVPHFFIQAKDKHLDNVAESNNSVVNRLGKLIPNPKINFKAANLGKFDYRLLLSNKNRVIKLDERIINAYIEQDLQKHFMMKGTLEEKGTSDDIYIYKEIRKKLLEVNKDVTYIVDVLVEYLYKHKNSSFKTTLWSSFGDIIVVNLKKNINMGFDDGYIQCEICGERIESKRNVQRYCRQCAKKINIQKTIENRKMKKLFEMTKTHNSL
ncbi:MAG: RNA dependent RNA polymerase [Bacillota bacterium]